MNLADILAQLRADSTDQKITIPPTWHQGRTAYGGLSSALASVDHERVLAAYVTGTKARALTSVVFGAPPAAPTPGESTP